MDKNTVTGIALIAIILIASFYFFSPPKPAKTEHKVKADTTITSVPKNTTAVADTGKSASIADSVAKPKATLNVPSGWESITKGEKREFTLENDKLRGSVTSKGGMINYAELKNYKTSDKKPLIMLDSVSHYGYRFPVGNIVINTCRF